MYFALAVVALAVCWIVVPTLMKRHRIIAMALVFIMVVASLAGTYALKRSSDAKLAAAKAVTALPEGTEEEWIEFVDKRFAAAIHRDGNVIRVATFSGKLHPIKGSAPRALAFTAGERNLSVDTPFSVECMPVLGGSVRFGRGEGSIAVYLFGASPYFALEPVPDDFPLAAPPLGVDPQSIAADRLFKRLCDRISEHMANVAAAQ